MIKPWRKALSKMVVFIVVVLMVGGFSAFNARKFCDEIMRAESLPPPCYSTRFVLNPEHDMDGADKIGSSPGWVITYASQTREYGVAFYVTLFGKIRARGTPNIVTCQHERDRINMDKFCAAFVQADTVVTVGSTFSNVVSVLGNKFVAFTNSDGSFSAVFDYLPLPKPPSKLITNGFSLLISNGIVVRKGYSYLQ